MRPELVTGPGEEAPLGLPPGEVAALQHGVAGRDAGGDLGADERAPVALRRPQDVSVPVEHLRERLALRLVGVDERDRGIGHVAAAVDVLERLGRARPEALVDGVELRVADADVDEEPDRDEDGRHRRGEHRRQAQPEREPAQPPSSRSRYPTRRTVSSACRPNGRSIFSRR